GGGRAGRGARRRRKQGLSPARAAPPRSESDEDLRRGPARRPVAFPADRGEASGAAWGNLPVICGGVSVWRPLDAHHVGDAPLGIQEHSQNSRSLRTLSSLEIPDDLLVEIVLEEHHPEAAERRNHEVDEAHRAAVPADVADTGLTPWGKLVTGAVQGCPAERLESALP